MGNPFFSVLTPVYNHGRFVAGALDSVLAQTDPDWESVVVDDGSTDDTPEVIARYAARDSRIRHFRQPNGGCASALNRAVAEMRGEWVLWLSSDDLFASDKLALHRDWIAKRPDRKFFFTHFCELDDETGQIREPDHWYPIPGDRWQVFDLLRCNYVNGISVCIHRDALAAAGRFDESLRMGQDYDMWLKLMARFPAVYVDRRTCTMRCHSASNTARHREALLFDAAKAATNFVNGHRLEAMAPLVNWCDYDDAMDAVGRAIDVAASPHSHLYKMGPHPALIARILEWVDRECRRSGCGAWRDHFVRRAETAGCSQAGSPLGTIWRAAASAARHGTRPVSYQPVNTEAVLDATYWRFKRHGGGDYDAVASYHRRFERRAVPDGEVCRPGGYDGELALVAAPGARLDDAIPSGALRMTLETAKAASRCGNVTVLLGQSSHTLRYVGGVVEIGCSDDDAVHAAVRSFRTPGALVAIARSDVFRGAAAGRRAVYHHNLYPIPGGMSPAELRRRRIGVFAVSQASREALARWGMPPELIRVVPSAYDTSVFRFPENDDARLPHDLVYAGDLYPLKGVDIALAALPLLRCVFPDARLHVFGAAVTGWTVGSDLFVRKEWIGGDGLLLWDRIQADVPGVVHHGHVGGGVLAQALGAAGLLLLPSRSESFGIVSLEAQACGCIPVLPAEGGMPETMEPDVTGFLYSPNTPERLAETLVRLWRDSRPSRESRLRAAARVREDYSFDRSGCAFMDAVAGLPSVPQAESVGLRLRMLASRLKAEIRRRANRGAWS